MDIAKGLTSSLKRPQINIKKEHIFLVIILAAASFLLLFNLGNQYLWQDEAQTALISKTVLTRGLPFGYDGKNFFSQIRGAEYGRNYIWRWQGWFPFYLLAAFFKLFGINTFTARLPFALFGIATILLMYYFSKSLFQNKRAAMTATALLALSTPFLILAKQCRYYSPAIFFSLLGLYSYLNVLQQKRYSSLIFVGALTLLFHSNYTSFGILLFSILVHYSLFYIRQLKILWLCLSAIAINLPWIVWFSGMKYDVTHRGSIFHLNIGPFKDSIWYYITRIEKHMFPAYLVLIALAVAIFNFKRIKNSFLENIQVWKNLALLIIFCIANILMLALVTDYAFFRYIGVLIPAVCTIVAGILVSLMKINFTAGIALVVLLVFSHSFADYIYEISHDYDGPIEGIVKYLNQYGTKDDTVAITYGDLPLKFYTDMRVVGGLTGEDCSLAAWAKWVILRKHSICPMDMATRECLIKTVPWDAFEMVTLDYPDTPFENREDPDQHYYRTVRNEDRVVIYRRIK